MFLMFLSDNFYIDSLLFVHALAASILPDIIFKAD